MEDKILCDCGHTENLSDVHGVYSEEYGQLIDVCDRCWSKSENIILDEDNKKSPYVLKGSKILDKRIKLKDTV